MASDPAPDDEPRTSRFERAGERFIDASIVWQLVRVCFFLLWLGVVVGSFIIGEYGLALIPIGIALVITVVLAIRSPDQPG